jgi:hypothetical protein
MKNIPVWLQTIIVILLSLFFYELMILIGKYFGEKVPMTIMGFSVAFIWIYGMLQIVSWTDKK